MKKKIKLITASHKIKRILKSQTGQFTLSAKNMTLYFILIPESEKVLNFPVSKTKKIYLNLKLSCQLKKK